jgi:hypothetical protein
MKKFLLTYLMLRGSKPLLQSSRMAVPHLGAVVSHHLQKQQQVRLRFEDRICDQSLKKRKLKIQQIIKKPFGTQDSSKSFKEIIPPIAF